MPRYEIAGLIVDMEPKNELLIQRAEPYIVQSKIDSPADCVIPRHRDPITAYKQKHPDVTYEECEYLLYGAYFHNTLYDYAGFALHAAAVVYQGRAYVFSGRSGVGKSTHASLWKDRFPGAFILNDDKPAIRKVQGGFMVFGTPFSGKFAINVNEAYPLQAICFLEQREANHIEKLTESQSVVQLLEQIQKPNNPQRGMKMMDTFQQLIERVSIYHMQCSKHISAAELSYDTMRPADALSSKN
ncbi:MAG: hypothetical protein PHO96_05405 [Candidatus Izemoplasmatales bacterium]|nr:hypothetical protein [Candidatus Izemoplasmatales bacterium]